MGKTFNNLCEGRASVESVDLNGKILEMKISTEIRDGSWNDEMEAASKRNFLGKSLNKGLIGRGL